MIRIRDISMPAEHDPNQLVFEASRLLRISASKIRGLRLVRRSIDGRKKPDIRWVYTIDVAVEGKVKTVKTKDKTIASTVDSYEKGFTLILSGDEIIRCASGYSNHII